MGKCSNCGYLKSYGPCAPDQYCDWRLCAIEDIEDEILDSCEGPERYKLPLPIEEIKEIVENAVLYYWREKKQHTDIFRVYDLLVSEKIKIENLEGKQVIERKSNYTAGEVDASGLPKQNYDYSWLKAGDLKPGQILLTFSRCKALRIPVKPGEQPAAFRRVQKGYVALYDRTTATDPELIYENEVYNGVFVKCYGCGKNNFIEMSYTTKADLKKDNKILLQSCQKCGEPIEYKPTHRVY